MPALKVGTMRTEFKVPSLRSETLVWVILLRFLLRSETLGAKCWISVKVSLRSQSLGARARQPDLLLRFFLRSETFVRSLVRGLVRSHGVPFSIAIQREPSKVSLRSETLAGASPKFWLRFFETLAETRGTLNSKRTVAGPDVAEPDFPEVRPDGPVLEDVHCGVS